MSKKTERNKTDLLSVYQIHVAELLANSSLVQVCKCVYAQLTNTIHQPSSIFLLSLGLSLLPIHLTSVPCCLKHWAVHSVFGFICWKQLQCPSMIYLLTSTVDPLTVNLIFSRKKTKNRLYIFYYTEPINHKKLLLRVIELVFQKELA